MYENKQTFVFVVTILDSFYWSNIGFTGFKNWHKVHTLKVKTTP